MTWTPCSKEEPDRRKKWVEDRADRKLSNTVQEAVEGAESIAELHAALMPIVDQRATPDLAPTRAPWFCNPARNVDDPAPTIPRVS